MAGLLFIVSREDPERYEFLRRAFADEPTVMVILDRRQRDRRMLPSKPSTERRRNERRAVDTTRNLQSLGWQLVRRPF